jgi:Flp pilus assembly protein protease CpaA
MTQQNGIWTMQIWIDSILIATMVVMAVFDLRQRILPNIGNALIAVLALIRQLCCAPVDSGLLLDPGLSVVIMLLLGTMLRRWRPDGLGLGDVKLLTALALYFGYEVFMMLWLAALTGLVNGLLMRQRAPKYQIPFGTHIAFWVIVWLLQPEFVTFMNHILLYAELY